MSYVNIWLAIPADDHNALNNRRGTEDNTGVAKQFVDGQLDPAVVQNLYSTHQQGQTTRHLWSVILEADSIPNSVNEFRQEFPGAQVLGCWNPDGSQVLDEFGEVRYVISDQLLNYMPPVWNGDDPATYSQATVVTDINLPAGWQPRDFS